MAIFAHPLADPLADPAPLSEKSPTNNIMANMQRIWTQLFPPATAPLTADNLPSQTGKVFIVTGGNGGIGCELVKILYGAGATVFLAARSHDKAIAAIETITKTTSTATGSIKYLHLDLADLSSVRSCANNFLATASRLDVLWNNAGVASISADKRTAQGLEMHMGVNCVGPYLLTQLLYPLLSATARKSTPNSVRVIWSSSMLVDALAPPTGIALEELSRPSTNVNRNYAISKTGNWFLAARLAKQVRRDNKTNNNGGSNAVISLAQNPGNLMTGIFSNAPAVVLVMTKPVLYKAVNGAHTALWAGLAQDKITIRDAGRYVIPWGRWHPRPRKDLLHAIRDTDEGGGGVAAAFEDWCKEKTARYH